MRARSVTGVKVRVVLSLGLIGKYDVSAGQCGLAIECHHLRGHVQLAIVAHHWVTVCTVVLIRLWTVSSTDHMIAILGQQRTELERGILFFENFDYFNDLL